MVALSKRANPAVAGSSGNFVRGSESILFNEPTTGFRPNGVELVQAVVRKHSGE